MTIEELVAQVRAERLAYWANFDAEADRRRAKARAACLIRADKAEYNVRKQDASSGRRDE